MGFLTGFPCCLSNLHQGWPKFTRNLWYGTSEGGLAALVYAPSRVEAKISGIEVIIEEITAYPFEETIVLKIDIPEGMSAEFPLELRVPSWTDSAAAVVVNGNECAGIVPGEIFRIEREWRDGDVVVLDFPMKTTVSRWYENAASVERGPLSYALKIESKWVEKFFTEDVGYGKTYWEVYPESPWNYALIKSDVYAPEKTFKVNTDSLRLSSDWYWSPDNAPVYIEARAARLPHWTLYNGSAGPFPYSQIPGKCASGNSAYRSSGEYERIILIPYGCTDLRISEFPVINN